MQEAAVPSFDDESQKTLEQRAKGAVMPTAPRKRGNWPFLVADTPAIKADHEADQTARPS